MLFIDLKGLKTEKLKEDGNIGTSRYNIGK